MLQLRCDKMFTSKKRGQGRLDAYVTVETFPATQRWQSSKYTLVPARRQVSNMYHLFYQKKTAKTLSAEL